MIKFARITAWLVILASVLFVFAGQSAAFQEVIAETDPRIALLPFLTCPAGFGVLIFLRLLKPKPKRSHLDSRAS